MYKIEFQRITNFLGITSDDKDLPWFVTKKWIKVYDESGGNYNVNKEIRIKKSVLRSDLCDYSDAYIVVKGTITAVRPHAAKKNKSVALKNNAPIINCISKSNGIKIDNAEDLDVVMPMHNLLEHSKNYRETTGSFWNYYRDEPGNPLSSNSKSFKYKTSIKGNTYNVDEKITNDDGNEVDNPKYEAPQVGKIEAEIVIPLKHLSNFWRSLDIPLIICEVELILIWSKNCVLSDMTTRHAEGDNPAIFASLELEFQITDTKLYFPVVTLSNKNDIKLLEQLKTRFERTIKWNKYRSQMTVQPQNNNLNYLTDATFTNVNRLFAVSFARNILGDKRGSFSHYYVPNVEIKDFNVLIDKKSFFNLPVKNE